MFLCVFLTDLSPLPDTLLLEVLCTKKQMLTLTRFALHRRARKRKRRLH